MFAIDFPIASNTHFIAKQSQEGRQIASINGALRIGESDLYSVVVGLIYRRAISVGLGVCCGYR